EQRDRATTDDDDERRAPGCERGARTEVAGGGRHLHFHFLVRGTAEGRPRMLRGVNAAAWKFQPGSLRNRLPQCSVANQECRPVELIFAASGEGPNAMLYS